MLGRTLFEEYDAFDSIGEVHGTIATPLMKIEFQYQGKGEKIVADNLEFVDFNVPPELISRGIEHAGIVVFLDDTFNIKLADRSFRKPDGLSVGRPERCDAQLMQGTMELVNEFKERFLENIIRRSQQVAGLYPLTAESFFGDVPGMGVVYSERFSIERLTKGCGSPEGEGAGFEISARTTKYQLRFNYHTPAKEMKQYRQGRGTLDIYRGNCRLAACLGDDFAIEKIEEDRSGRKYEGKALKTGAGRELLIRISELWQEFRSELGVDKRIKYYKDVTAEEFFRVQRVLDYIENGRSFPYIEKVA